MQSSTFKKILFALPLAALGLFAVGCSGNTSGGSAEEDANSAGTFQADSSNTGSLTLNVATPRLGIGETSGFFVTVANASGQGIPQTRVSCDTESGVALIEPNTGTFQTDSVGGASGVIGCVEPGSHQMACRLQAGANRRVFQTIICEGARPGNFTGFPGAGGGGLFGGVADSDDDIEDGDRAEIVNLTVIQGGGGNAFQIDLVQNPDCDGDVSTTDPEPYGPDLLSVTIRNNGARVAEFVRANYTIPNGLSGGGTFSSPDFFGNAGSNGLIEIDGELTLDIPFTIQTSPKTYAGSTTEIPTGFRNLNLTVIIEFDDGSRQTLSTRVGLNFASFNVCAA